MRRAGWRQHVAAELRRRERSGRGLRALMERHEKLQERLEAQQARETQEPPRDALGAPLQPLSLWMQLEMEAKELRQEKEELHQQVALVTGMLGDMEAENQEQRSRMGRLAQDAAALKRCSEELQCQAWLASQEAEGLRRELEQMRGLLQEARQARQELEERWMQEKALEAKRLNWANEQEEKYRRKIIHLRGKLEQLREASGLEPRPGGATAPGDVSFGASCEAAEMPSARLKVQAESPTMSLAGQESGNGSGSAGVVPVPGVGRWS